MTQTHSASTLPPASFESRRAALALMEAMIPGAPGIPGIGEGLKGVAPPIFN